VIECERSGPSIPLKIIGKKNDPKGYRIVAAQRSQGADGAIASFSSSLFPSARMLIARRS